MSLATYDGREDLPPKPNSAMSMKINEASNRIIHSNRVASFTTVFVLLFAMAAAALSATWVIVSRPTHLELTSDGQSVIADNNNKPILVGGEVEREVELFALPSLGKGFHYLSVTEVYLNVNDDETVGFRVEGFHWHNVTAMDLFLANGLTLEITYEQAVLTSTGAIDPSSMSVQQNRRRLIAPLVVLGGKLLVKGAVSGVGAWTARQGLDRVG